MSFSKIRSSLAALEDRLRPPAGDIAAAVEDGLARLGSDLPGIEDDLRAAADRAASQGQDALAGLNDDLPGIDDDLRGSLGTAAAQGEDALAALAGAVRDGVVAAAGVAPDPAAPDAGESELSLALREALAALPALEDRIRDELSAAGDPSRDAAEGLDTALSGLEGLDLSDLDIATLADLAGRLPDDLAGPDPTGEVPTGSAEVTRAEAALSARLAVAPRIIETLGADVLSIEVEGGSFRPMERYADPASGFLAHRLTPEAGGAEVFVVDGLQVGSRADAVAAATLGRFQAESEAFAAMVEDARTLALEEGRELLFAGPSLGGALAQVAAYEAAEGLVASGEPFATGAVRLVTVDPLGGRDAAEAINGGTLDPAALALIEALHLRNDGDLITRIGSHVGATLTLPTLDADGNRVELTAAEAHVNALSLLQVLGSDALFAEGVPGAPEEIGGFAALSEVLGEGIQAAWLASGEDGEVAPGRLQAPGTASLDASRTVWSLDADDDGAADVVARLGAPLSPAAADLALIG